MSSHIIYEFALPKAKNLHYLRRYLNFIERCKIANEINPPNYVENHHILPKAKDLFPEYSDNKQKYKWNSVNLSFRQHLIAHVMLWKIFGDSQTLALKWMLSENTNEDFESKRKIPSSLKLRYLEQVRIEWISNISGKSHYYDEDGNAHLLESNDPKILEFNLVTSIWYNDGNKSYRIPRNEEPESHWVPGRLIEFSDEVLKMYSEKAVGSTGYNDGINNFFVSVGNEPESHWVKGILVNEEKHQASLQKRSKRFANSKWYNNGVRNFNVADGDLPDPDWAEGKICNFTEEGLERLSKKAAGSQYYNDGVCNFKIDAGIEPDPSWLKGMIIDSEAQARNSEFNRKKFTGSQFWNDGVKNHLVFVGQEPEAHWIKGMVTNTAQLERAKEFGKRRMAGCKVYNDGIRAYKIQAGCKPEPHWVEGYLPRPVRRMYNNGLITKMFESDPGGDWILGKCKKKK